MSFTANVFDLLGDEGDDRPRKAPKAPKPAATTAPTTTSKPAQPAAAQQQKAAPAKPAAAAPAKKDEGRGPRPQGDAPRSRPNNANRPAGQRQGGAAVSAYESEKPPRKDKRDTRERPAHTRGRQFDRRSGTGRPPNENKKSGSGKGNWGKDGEEVSQVEGAPVAEVEKEEAAPVEGEAAPEAAEAEPPKEPEKEFLSYDEYLASKKKKAIEGVEAPKLRVAGEGVDQSAWAAYAPLAKEEDADVVAKKKSAKEPKEAAKGGEEKKVAVDKFFRVTMPRPQSDDRRGDRRDRGERRDRGGERRDRGDRGDRGGRGGKSPKGPRNDRGSEQQKPAPAQAEAHPINLADFPALGGSGGVSATTAPAQAPAPVKA